MRFAENLAKAAVPFLVLSLAAMALDRYEVLNPYWIQIFEHACIVAVSALGLNIIYGFTGLFSLGHAAFYGVGAYTAAFLMKTYLAAHADPSLLASQAVFVGSLLAGGAAAALLATTAGDAE